MKITTSCSGRFHIFDQASQLQRHGVLRLLINGYPKWMTRRWGIPNDKVKRLLFNGIIARFATMLPTVTPMAVRDGILHVVHDLFSRRLALHIPPDSDIFIGLSSFCLEGLRLAQECGMVAIVDHGSLHIRHECALMEEEARRLGLPVDRDLAPQWLIDKEDQEFHMADHIMVLSEVAKRTMVEQGLPSEKIFVNQCGVDLRHFSPGHKQDDVFRVIYCGAISPRKGIYYLLRAFSELNLPNAELWVVGKAANPDFEKLLRRFHAPQVRFLGTFPQRRLAQIYSQGSVFVLPSIADGFGMVVPQAMACGLPAIVTENVGASDIIVHGKNGYILPIRDVDALKSHLLRLYQEPNLAAAMGRGAAESATRFSWDAYGDRLVNYLENCLQRSYANALPRQSEDMSAVYGEAGA